MFKDRQSYIVLDVETGGLDPDKHSILEISGILWKPGRKIQPAFDCYVKEENIVTVPRAMEVNQIDLNKVSKHGRTPKEAVKYIKNRLDEVLGVERRPVKILAHNANFDYSFLKRLYNLAGEKTHQDFYGRTIDSASILEFLMIVDHIKGNRASADVLFESTNNQIKDEERHRSYYDALATAKSMETLFNIYLNGGK
jgi:DNA polymerase III epsilon subunit-like protein